MGDSHCLPSLIPNYIIFIVEKVVSIRLIFLNVWKKNVLMQKLRLPLEKEVRKWKKCKRTLHLVSWAQIMIKSYFFIECWEFFLNDKCVHSRRLLYGKKFPDMDKMIEISLQMNEVCIKRFNNNISGRFNHYVLSFSFNLNIFSQFSG